VIMKNETTIPRLYRLNSTLYIQYNGVGPLPKEVNAYARNHNRDYLAYIPLPDRSTEFDFGGTKGVLWDGRSPLPEEVMAYVCEHGTLPRHKSDADDSTERIPIGIE